VRSNGTVSGATVKDLRTGEVLTVSADLVVNAAGPWAGKVAALCGVEVPIRPGPGVMVAVSERFTNMIINRMHPAGEGDILVAQRNQTIIGTTIWLADDPDAVGVPPEQVERLRTMGARLVPALSRAPVRAVWSASRPLLRSNDMNSPMLTSRGFVCIDHEQQDGVAGMISLVGGKATTLRAMAQEAADLICRKTGRSIACATVKTPLQPYRKIMHHPHAWI
jgi:glycerol-3-phosphate dehydrogenase